MRHMISSNVRPTHTIFLGATADML